MGMLEECRAMSNDELEKSLKFLAHHEKRAVARLLAHLAVFDERQLAMERKGRSLFDYCLRDLGYDEGDAFRRIRGARVSLKFPIALDHVENGKLSLTSLVVLHPILKPENFREWFQKAEGKTRKQLELMIASVFPEHDKPDFMRRLPPGYPALVPAAPEQAVDVLPPQAPAAPAEWLAIPSGDAPSGRVWQDVYPISADRVRIGFDAAANLMKLIERARQLLRHKYPEGRLEDVMLDVLETFLERRDPQRRLALKKSAPPMPKDAVMAADDKEEGRLPTRFLRAYAAGRYIPAKVKSAVWARDDGRCTWRFDDGTICGGRDFVEFDHIVPFAKGGRSDYRNIRLLCRAHNQLAAEKAFPSPNVSALTSTDPPSAPI